MMLGEGVGEGESTPQIWRGTKGGLVKRKVEY